MGIVQFPMGIADLALLFQHIMTPLRVIIISNEHLIQSDCFADRS